MQVRVLFFGVLKDLAGRSSDVLSLPDQALARDVLTHYEQRLSTAKGMLGSIAISVNQEYARPEHKLNAGDEVALLPPVSGGATDVQAVSAETETPRAFVTHQPISTAAFLERIKHGADGAAVTFEGIVRNNSRGRRTLFLEYEGYEEMALKQMESLVTQARGQFEIRDAMIVHRLGHLEVGEASVVIIVASAHRAAAFDACRWLIDTLKRTVPIWKKEHFEDGAVWSDGEPFPPDILQVPTSSHIQQLHSAAEIPNESTGSHTPNSASNPIAPK